MAGLARARVQSASGGGQVGHTSPTHQTVLRAWPHRNACGFDLADVIEGKETPMTVRRILALIALGLFFGVIPV